MADQSRLSANERAYLDAATNGDATKVRELLAQGIPVDLRDDWNMPWDQTALMYAARNGHLEVVRILLKAGANVAAKDKNARESDGENQPLHHAAAGGNVAVIEELIAAGADPNALNSFGNTPLNRAIEGNNLDAARLLLQRGANVNLKPGRKRYRPPLCAAGWAKIPPTAIRDFILLLIEAKADPNLTDNLGQTALFPLVTARDVPNDIAIPLVESLLKAGAKPDPVEKDGSTPLLNATVYWNPPAVKTLLRAGADANRIYARGTLLDINDQDAANLGNQFNNLSSSLAAAKGEEAQQLHKVIPMVEDKLRRCQEIGRMLREFGAKHKNELP